MGFSAKQTLALKRNLDHRNVRTREAHGRELSYIEGWYAISEANRIFGFDGWSRETVEFQMRAGAREPRQLHCRLYRAGPHHRAGGRRNRDPRGSWHRRRPRNVTGRGARHRAQGRRNRRDQAGAGHLRQAVRACPLWQRQGGIVAKGDSSRISASSMPAYPSNRSPVTLPPDDTTPIPRPSRYYGRRQDMVTRDRAQAQPATGHPAIRQTPRLSRPPRTGPGQDRQKRSDHFRTQTAARQGSSAVCEVSSPA